MRVHRVSLRNDFGKFIRKTKKGKALVCIWRRGGGHDSPMVSACGAGPSRASAVANIASCDICRREYSVRTTRLPSLTLEILVKLAERRRVRCA